MRSLRSIATTLMLLGTTMLAAGPLPVRAQAVGEEHQHDAGTAAPAHKGPAPMPRPMAGDTGKPMTGPGMAMMKGMMGGEMAKPEGCPGMPGMSEMNALPDDPVTAAFAAINLRMHKAMMVTPSGSADRDFATAMIAHHQGAVDMAKVVLGFGSDPEIRKLAEGIVAAQQQEIALMQAWLAKQP